MITISDDQNTMILDGKAYQTSRADQSGTCIGCAFHRPKTGSCSFPGRSPCSARTRHDAKDKIWKEA